MNDYSKYWVATAIRGLFAIVIGSGIILLSDLAKTLLLLPLAIVFSGLCLATYVVVDSALVAASSFLIPRSGQGRIASRIQGFAGLVIGVLLFLVSSGKLQLTWFVYLAVIQACCTAIGELIVGKETATLHRTNWCYLSSVIAFLSAVTLLLCRNLVPHALAWVIYGYVGFFGLNMLLLSAHMLFEETHPDPQVSK